MSIKSKSYDYINEIKNICDGTNNIKFKLFYRVDTFDYHIINIIKIYFNHYKTSSVVHRDKDNHLFDCCLDLSFSGCQFHLCIDKLVFS